MTASKMDNPSSVAWSPTRARRPLRAAFGWLAGLLLAVLAGCGSATGEAESAATSMETVPLSAGCNEVALTWPVGTPYSEVVAAISRRDGIESLWQFDADRDTFDERSLDSAAGTLTRSRPERAVICTNVAAVLTRPRGSGRESAVARRVARPASVTLPTPLATAEPVVQAVVTPTEMPAPTPTAAPAATATTTPESTVAPVGAPATIPTPVAGSGPAAPRTFVTVPPGAALPSEERCAAAVARSGWEPRPENRVANQTRGRPLTNTTLVGLDNGRVTGNFVGTTDEIMQWGACKWGFDADLVRAMAVQESYWRQAAVGDHNTSFGLLQIKNTAHAGTFPLSRESTAFNVDYVLAWMRGCYDGNYGYWLAASARGDLWGCVGAWYAGAWRDAGATFYIGTIQRQYSDKAWLRPGF